MKIFHEINIILKALPPDRQEIIKECVQILVDKGVVKQEYLEDMREHEKLVSTYIGNNVAIPHGLSNSGESIIHSGLSLVQVPEGVSFGDDKTAYLVIGIAGKDGQHLEMLSQVAQVLLDMDNVNAIKNAKTEKEILDIFRAVV